MSSLILVRQPLKEKENPEFERVKLPFDSDLVSQPACVVGWLVVRLDAFLWCINDFRVI